MRQSSGGKRRRAAVHRRQKLPHCHPMRPQRPLLPLRRGWEVLFCLLLLLLQNQMRPRQSSFSLK